jgi:predicted signal transduction protein with EAL and GGDEF domain
LRRLLVVPADNADLLKAQFEVFSKQVPLMYAIVLINAWALAFTFAQRAPGWLTIWIPGLHLGGVLCPCRALVALGFARA